MAAYGTGTYGAGAFGIGVLDAPPVAPGGDVPVAGRAYALTYYARDTAGNLTDVTSVLSTALYDPAGTLVLTVPGPASRVDVGTYRFPAAVMPAAGAYLARTTFTDSGTTFVDTDDTVLVYGLGGQLEQVSGGRLANLEMFRRLAPTAHRAADIDVVRYLRAADEVAASIVGPLPPVGLPVPEAWREAAVIIAVHLSERHNGAIPSGSFGGDTDETVNYGFGYSIPAAALELLRSTRIGLDGLPVTALKQQAPAFAFPVAREYPAGW